MPIRRSRLALAAVACCAVVAACYDVSRTSARREVVAADWEGQWDGGWTSSANATTGTLRLFAQSFEDHPVLQVETDNPCIAAVEFTFSQRGLQWDLRGSDGSKFEGLLNPSRREITGTYECAQDAGTWTVDLARALPPIEDLGGEWTGTVHTDVPRLQAPFVLNLDQLWWNGSLRLVGEVWIPQLALRLPVADGRIQWRDDRFTMALRTDGAAGPELFLHGIGESLERQIEDGLLFVDDPRVPFRVGNWDALWVGN